MKTYDNKILRNIINNFNNDDIRLTLDSFITKMEKLGFTSCQDVPKAISKNYLVFRTMIDGEFVDVFISYLPSDLANVARFKVAYQEFVDYKINASDTSNYEEHDRYKSLEYLYICRKINVQFLYVEEED